MQSSAPTVSITIRIRRHFFNSVLTAFCEKAAASILRDYTSSDFVVWLMNHLEMPLANLVGHGDVKIHQSRQNSSPWQKNPVSPS